MFQKKYVPIKALAGLLMFLIIFGCISAAYAAGRSAFPVVKTQMDPRALALGGAPITITQWSGGASLNPASAAGAPRSASITFAKHTLDLWSGRIVGSYELPSGAITGVFFSTFNFGEFENSALGAGKTGETFTAGEYVLGGYYADSYGENLTYGISGKIITGIIDQENALGAGVDLGFCWDANWEMIRLGAVARNLGKQFNGYGSDPDPMPVELLIGGSKKLSHLPLTLHVVGILAQTGEEDWDLDWIPGKPGFGFGAGGEFEILPEGREEPLYVRIGYRSRGRSMQVGHRLDTIAGFTFGIGLPVKMLNIDYTFAPMSALGDVHRFGIATEF